MGRYEWGFTPFSGFDIHIGSRGRKAQLKIPLLKLMTKFGIKLPATHMAPGYSLRFRFYRLADYTLATSSGEDAGVLESMWVYRG